MARTISEVLARARALLAENQIESARIDAELLLAHALGLRRIDLIMHRDRSVSDEEAQQVDALVSRRLKKEPVAYIIGSKEFFGREFRVGPGVLIPRPETEILVEQAVLLAPEKGAVFEVGVGSGAVIVSVLCERADLTGFGNDISIEALRTARENARILGVSDRLGLFGGSVLEAHRGSWQLILANPPYIPLADEAGMDDDVRIYEPREALFGGKDGLDIVKEILKEAPAHLAPGGMLVMEAGFAQREAIETLVSGEASLRIRSWVRDLSGIARTVIIERIHDG